METNFAGRGSLKSKLKTSTNAQQSYASEQFWVIIRLTFYHATFKLFAFLLNGLFIMSITFSAHNLLSFFLLEGGGHHSQL